MKNAYSGSLDIPEGSSGGVHLEHMLYPAGTKLTSGTVRTAIFGQKADELLFEEPTRWHRLTEDDYGTWMTDLPIEQRQADQLIKGARGRVLVGGLGLGYAVVALSKRSRVREITVVERSADVIKLVWEPTVKRVQGAVQLHIVHDDLFGYLKALDKRFPWAFYDIWQSDSEGTFHQTVLPLRKLSAGKIGQVVCWNEDIMRGQLNMKIRLRLQFMGHEGVPTLDQLCELTGNVYEDWAVPFWQWYRECGKLVKPEALTWIIDRYVHNYGILPAYLPNPVPHWISNLL